MPLQIGGSFAPPLTAEKLEEYRALAEQAKESQPEAADIMSKLIKMAAKFQETPESKLPGTPHMSGRGTVIPLEPEEAKRIFDDVPWDWELKAYGQVLEKLPSDSPESKALRDAAFHLLWYGKELCNDREPMTSDKL